MSRIRVVVTLLAGAALALVVLGPASARTQLGSKYGGTLVVGLGQGDPGSLDPTVSRGTASVKIYRTMCRQLYGYVANHGRFERVPDLAAALPVRSKDKLTVTVQLRRGVKFNDGTPLDADAVVTSYRRYVSYPDSSLAADFEHVASATAAGPYTVVFRLNQRDSTFAGGSMYVLSPTALAKAGSNFAANPVCAGPFMFDHRVVGDHVTVVKSPYWFDQKNVYLDKIVFKPTPDAASGAAALKAGDIQVLDTVSTTEVKGLEERSSVRVIRLTGAGWRGVVFNIGNKNGSGTAPAAVGTPLASSPKLRQAFEEAIDREALVRVLFGDLVPPSCTPVPKANGTWFNANIKCTPYDLEHARKLVAQSGFPNPTVHLQTTNVTDQVRLAQFIQAAEAQIGINVVIDVFDTATDSARKTAGTFDAALIGNCCSGDGDPNFFARSLRTGSVRNSNGYSNPRVDLILDNGVKATSIQARKKLYDVLQEILVSDRPYIALYPPVNFVAHSANVTGVQISPGALAIDVSGARYR